MKKRIKKCICLFLMFICIVNTYKMFFLHNAVVPNFGETIKSSSVTSDHKWQGDYTLYYSDNNLFDFPYIFGTRLYLYSAKDGDKYLIHRQLMLLEEWAGDFTFYGNQVLGVGGVALDIPNDTILIKLNGGSQVIEEILSNNQCTLTNHGIYYTGKLYDDETERLLGYGFCCYDGESGTIKKLCKTNRYDVLQFIIRNKAIIANHEEEYAYIYDLNTGKKTDYDYNSIPSYIVEVGESAFYGIHWNGEIIKYDAESLQGTYVSTIDVDYEDIWWDISADYINGALYINNPQNEVIRVNLEDGSQKKIISVEDITNHQNMSERNPYISFCDNNIVYEVYYKDYHLLSQIIYGGTDDKRKLLVYDYEGNLVRIEKNI